MSTCEGELIAAATPLVLGRTARLMFSEFWGTSGTVHDQFRIMIDSQAALSHVRLGEHASWRTRHISIRGNAIYSASEYGEVAVQYCPTDEMAADGLTKGLTSALLGRMRVLWGLVSV